METTLRAIFMSIPGSVYLLSKWKPATMDVFHSLLAKRKIDVIQVSVEQPQSYWSHFEFSFAWLDLFEAILVSFLGWYIFQTIAHNIISQPGQVFLNDSTTIGFQIAAWTFFLQRVISNSGPSFFDIPMLFFYLWVALHMKQKQGATIAWILFGIYVWRVLYAISMSFVKGQQSKILQILSS